MWTNGDLRYLALFLEECIDNSRRNIEVNTWLSLASVSNVDVRFSFSPYSSGESPSGSGSVPSDRCLSPKHVFLCFLNLGYDDTKIRFHICRCLWYCRCKKGSDLDGAVVEWSKRGLTSFPCPRPKLALHSLLPAWLGL